MFFNAHNNANFTIKNTSGGNKLPSTIDSHRRKRRDVRIVKDYKDYVFFNAQNNANSSLKGQQVTSGGNKLSSWMDTVVSAFTNTIADVAKGVSQLISSPLKTSLPSSPTLSSQKESFKPQFWIRKQ